MTCIHCRQRVFRVQNRFGKVFLVDPHGRVSCPLGGIR